MNLQCATRRVAGSERQKPDLAGSASAGTSAHCGRIVRQSSGGPDTAGDGAAGRSCESSVMPVPKFQLPSTLTSAYAALPPPPFRSRAGTRAVAVLAGALGFLIVGCGGGPPQSETIERQYFTLRDEQGNERLAPAEELFDGEAGEDAADLEILVLDRKTGSETWILFADLGREPPALARYVPRTRTETEVEELTSESQ